uniref:Uncharacterized protein n=1 Tax=Rhizophora mucronata TaxID=61149 RepID=A0A2P2N995_RHIMU
MIKDSETNSRIQEIANTEVIAPQASTQANI